MNPLAKARETIAPVVQKGLFSTKLLSTEPTNFFAITERRKILNEILSPPQPFGNELHPVESLFRSLYQTLIDAVFAENTFTSNFFQNNELTNSIFRLTFKFIESFMDNLIEKITDPVCIVFLLEIIFSQKKIISKSQILCLDKNSMFLKNKLINRYKTILITNNDSIKYCNLNYFINPYKITSFILRFGDLSQSLSFFQDLEVQQIIVSELSILSNSIIEILNKISKTFLEEEKRIIFLINNYYHVVLLLSGFEEKSSLYPIYAKILKEAIENYILFKIKFNFSRLYETVISAYSSLDSSEPNEINISTNEIKEIAIDFKEKYFKILKDVDNYHQTIFCDHIN